MNTPIGSSSALRSSILPLRFRARSAVGFRLNLLRMHHHLGSLMRQPAFTAFALEELRRNN